MSITFDVQNAVCTYKLNGIPPVTNQDLIFTHVDQSDNAGIRYLGNILRAPWCKSVGLTARDGITVIPVTLIEGENWEKSSNSAGLTRKQMIADFLQSRVYAPDALPLIDRNMGAYLDTGFLDEVQKHLDTMASKGTISTKEHGGGIVAREYNPVDKTLRLEFRGACVSKCIATQGKDAKSGTEAVVVSQLFERFPGAFSRNHIIFQEP